MAVRKIFIAEISRTMMYAAGSTHTAVRDRALAYSSTRVHKPAWVDGNVFA